MSSLKTAAVFFNVNEAQIARAFLESNGVQALVPDSHTATNLSYMTPFIGGVRVVVPEEQLELAQKMLRTQENFRLVETDEGTADGPHFELVDKSLGQPSPTDSGPRPTPETSTRQDFTSDPSPALTRALKAGVLGLLVPVIPTLISFFFLGRYLRDQGRDPLSIHFWLILLLNVIGLGMMILIFLSARAGYGHS